MKGLAQDGGLFVPSQIPKVPSEKLREWRKLDFEELAYNIMKLYIDGSEIPEEDLKDLIHRSYATFRSSEVTPIKELNQDRGLYLLELFHGPTYAFKDVALQFVGNLFEYFLKKQNRGIKDPKSRKQLTVVGATSGDTGSAAIYGLRGKSDVSVFILYPDGRISPIQEEQMTTVEDTNVHTLAVKGTFDDCQDIVKQIFGDEEFNKTHHVGAVNSINWARILAQMTYYFFSYFRLLDHLKTDEADTNFVVPSGNFGDIMAGYFAKRMGLPANKLIIATNENDILDRFLKSGKYEKGGEVKATYSPAMDILISSNFERLLWYLARDNLTKDNDIEAGQILNDWMNQLKTKGVFSVPESVVQATKRDFDSHRVTNAQTTESIRDLYLSHDEKYIMDPHTAVGVFASNHFIKNEDGKNVKYISLSTAHPAKFSEVVNEALGNIEGYSFERDVLPSELKQLSTKEKRILKIDNPSLALVKTAIIEQLKLEGKE